MNVKKQPPAVFCRKGVLRNFAKFTGKRLCFSPVTLLKKSPWHRCFPVNFAKFLRTPFLQNTSGRLLMYETNLEKDRMITDNMENYQAYQCCYHEYVSYFKQCFPLAPCPTFEEWAEKNSGSSSSNTKPSTFRRICYCIHCRI